ncbi:MAG: hypothetical protein GC202_02045 [Alphaproteobacteria bacterium]|nr:hypothetical protein [Alphaproteobacteria bacterium]
MANFLFSYQNWIDQAGAALTASHEVTTLPVANLQNADILKVWRSAGSTVPWVQADLGQARAIRVLGLFGLVALASGDTVRWRLGTTPGAGDVYDSGAVACGRAPGYAKSLHCLAASLSARYVRVDLSAPSLATTYIDVGRLWVGDAWQGARNFSYGISHAIDDGKSKQVAADGAPNSSVFVDPRAVGQTVSFALEAVGESEMWNYAMEIQRVPGRKRQVLFVPDPDSAWINRAAVLGLIEKSDSIKQMSFPLRTTSFDVRGALLEE